MTLTALCERFIDKSYSISVVELKDNGSTETLIDCEKVWLLEYSQWALYSVKYIEPVSALMTVYVTPPNDGYKKADF